MSTSSSPRGLAGVAWAFGLGFFAVAAVVAFGVVQMYLVMAQQAFGGGLAVPLVFWGGLAALACLAWIGMRRPASLEGPLPVALGLAMLLATRGLASWYLDGPLVSDFLEYHDLALAAARGGPWFSDLRPMGYPLLKAAGFAVLGPVPWFGEALNLFLAAVTGTFLYLWARRIWGAAAAVLALWLYAFTPAHALMAAVQGTEIPYAAAFMGALWALAAAPPWVAGLMLGLSQYVRPTSLILVPAVALYYRSWKPLLAFGVAVLLVLAPVVGWNWQTHHKLSLSTSTYGGWSLLVGTNQVSNGFWNLDDTILVNKLPFDQRDQFAREEAKRRVLSDPLGFGALALRKFGFLWGAEDFGTYWTLGVRPQADQRPATALYLLSQAAYCLILVLAGVGLWLERRRPAEPVVLALLGLASLVAAHTFLEVQSRYHFYWTPVFAGLAGVGLLRLWEAVTPRAGSRPDPAPAPATSPAPLPGPTP
ncbi:MAG: hypothetical protein JWM80_4025 [Cyanobacteria bacterium RYN_339]|nr:hypothetical protein [Cyanobacteria bacterium RYN_339]